MLIVAPYVARKRMSSIEFYRLTGFTTFVSCNTYVSTQKLKTELKVIFPLRSDNDVGRDKVVSIATRYGVDGPGIESR